MYKLTRLSARLFLVLLLAYFAGCHSPSVNKATQQTDSSGTNNSWALLAFIKVDSINPILAPSNAEFFCPASHKQTKWEAKNVFNPATVVRNNKIYLLYRAQDSAGTSRIGLAESMDGLHFKRNEQPVLFPGNDPVRQYEWPGGCEDPRVIEDSSGTYYMMYTGYDGKTARLLLATSKDLLHWTKHGPVFKGKYKDIWSKSGSVVSNYQNGRIIATKINGKYWMYWGDV